MTITITEHNKPLGYYTWVAVLRNGKAIRECPNDTTIVSFDIIKNEDIAEFHLVPYLQDDTRSYIRFDVAPGESIKKMWVRTGQFGLNGVETAEGPVIDGFQLLSSLPIQHFAYIDGSLRITTSTEP